MNKLKFTDKNWGKLALLVGVTLVLAAVPAAQAGGLVASYNFEDNVLDSSDSMLHGTAIGTGIGFSTSVPAAINGRSNKSINLSGDAGSDFVALPANFNTAAQAPAGATVSLWVQTAGVVDQDYVFSVGNSGSNTAFYGIQGDPGDNSKARLFYRNDAATSANATGTATVFGNGWNHLVLTSDGSTMKVYVNGAANPDITLSLPGGALTVDRQAVGVLDRSSRYGYLAGQIDEVAVFNRVLTTDEIAQLGAGLDPTAILDNTPSLQLSVSSDGTDLHFAWNSEAGRYYNLRTSEDLSTATATWDLQEGDIPATAPLNIRMIAKPVDPRRFYVVEESTPPPPISEIWDPSAPFPSSSEAPLLSGVTFQVIKHYEPDVDGYHWLHGGTIIRHEGTWFMTWGHNSGAENTSSEVTQGRRSNDEFATLTPVEMIAPGTETDASSHGVTLSLNGDLWGFFGRFTGFRQNAGTEVFKLNEVTDEWESQGAAMNDGFWAYDEPKRMDNGNYITAGFRMSVANGNPPAVAISNGEDMTDWTVVPIPKPAGLNGMWGESSVIVRGSHLLCIVRNSGSDAWAYVSVSNDYGITWTPVERSNMRMIGSKPYAGTLSDNRDYLICTTTSNAGNTRRPLTIALTDPGGGQFNKVYRIRDGIRPGETSTVAAELAYPYAVEYNGSLYVVYSVGRPGNAKNSLELAIIPLSSLAD